VRCCLACGEAVFETVDPNTIGGSSSASPSPYEYIPLNYKLGQEIRLLVVWPGELCDPLKCDIIHVNLEDQPKYEAVSYTWTSDDQDATLSQYINCGNDRYIAATLNCDIALRQLRRHGRGVKRRLWIDAVCIDQTNIKERNHQVGLMDRVYCQAQSVRICLWDEHSNYEELFRWLQEGPTARVVHSETWLVSMMQKLFSHRYFKRAWVIQEVVLARVVYLLVNDDELILSWRVIDRLSFIVESYCFHYQLPGVLRIRQRADLTSSVDIVACLRAGFKCQCTDARDKVYAVLSLMGTQSRSLIPVDYSLDVESVYANVVNAIVVSHGNLDILSYAGYSSTPQGRSWYEWPAFTMEQLGMFLDEKDQREKTFLRRQFQGDAIGPWRANIEVCTTDEMDNTPSPAIPSAHITAVFCRRPDSYTSMSLNIMPRFRIRAHFIDKIVCSCSYTGLVQHISNSDQEKNRASRIGETICHSPTRYHYIMLFFLERGITPSQYSMYDLSWSANIPYQEDKDEVRRDEVFDCNLNDLVAFATIAKERGTRKMMFLTRNSIGFASRGFEPDDEIWAIDGARTPFILRKTGPKTYCIVRECYLWAALELDYWNPGTKKGRWSENRPAHNEQQTHIIEIRSACEWEPSALWSREFGWV
jgi:hypothetical protein